MRAIKTLVSRGDAKHWEPASTVSRAFSPILGVSRDPPPDAEEAYASRGEAGELLRRARQHGGNLASLELGVPTTRHARLVEGASAACERLEQRLDEAKARGALQFNQQYRARRLAARQAGEPFMPFSAARSKLERTLAEVAAGKVNDNIVARVFDV